MRIAIIEDDRDINELLAYNLSREGMEITSFFDGAEAKSRLKNEEFDIVIVDIMLPGGVDGFQLCKMIKEDSNMFKTFVVVASARSATQDKIYAHLVGADYYLVKPFSIPMLLGIVRDIHDMKHHAYSVSAG